MGIEEEERVFKKGTVMKDPTKGGFGVKANNSSRNAKNFYPGGVPAYIAEKRERVSFDDSMYDELHYVSDDKDITGEELRKIIEAKVFDCTLDSEFLNNIGLKQEDLEIAYCHGKLPCEPNKFINIVMSCPVVEDIEEEI